MKSGRIAWMLGATAVATAGAWGAGCGSSPAGSIFTGGAFAASSGTGASTGTASTSNGSGGPGAGGASTGAGAGAGTGTTTTGNSSSGISLAGTGSGGPACTGLECQVHSCTGSATTTITGTIYDPAGNNPLYGVVAYVPNSTPSPFTSGAQCTTCDGLYSGDPIAAAVTDASGNFTITNAPDGADIPLVIQVGKWRRQFTLPKVTECGSTAVPDKTLTLPKNGTEGDLPQFAISTGGADTLECLLVRVGVDEAEYTPGPGGTGHVHIFQGTGGPNTSPAAPTPETSLWDSDGDIGKYDIVLLSCEGHETDDMNQQALFDYATAGGRVFASHFHYAWFDTGPFSNENLATWFTGANALGNTNASVVTTEWDGTPFARGQAMFQWLTNVGALSNNVLPIDQPKHNANVSATNTPSQPWLVVQNDTAEVQDFTFDTPFGVDAGAQCGRVAFSDMHVSSGSGDYKKGLPKTTPQGCSTGMLSPQEKALEFILFDLSSCVTPNNMVQQPPPVMAQ